MIDNKSFWLYNTVIDSNKQGLKMARKTKAELAAEREAVEAERRSQEKMAYPTRLMMALEEATTKNDYELEVRNGMFSLRDRNSRSDLTLSLTLAYTENSFNALETLEYDLEQAADERAEAERRYAMKQAALTKLTKEERELLGL
jgi:hypothetical protein